MNDNIDQKKIFLVVTGVIEIRNRITELIESHISNTTIFSAQDGLEALSKLENAPPHVLLIDPQLNKTSGWQVINHILADRKFKETAIIILSPAPEYEKFIDEVVIGRAQYINPDSDQALIKSFAKALNYVAHGEVAEFYLKFLSEGDVLIREGEAANFVYLVRRGSLRAYTHKNNTEIEIGVIREGEFVGEMAYINNDRRSADVIATSDCELIEIPINHLDQLLFQKPSWSKALMITLSTRVKKANDSLKYQKAE